MGGCLGAVSEATGAIMIILTPGQFIAFVAIVVTISYVIGYARGREDAEDAMSLSDFLRDLRRSW